MADEPDDAALDARLKVATASGDAVALAGLYRLAGDRGAARGETDAAAFFWTQAHVWALVAGDDALAATLESQLRAVGGQIEMTHNHKTGVPIRTQPGPARGAARR